LSLAEALRKAPTIHENLQSAESLSQINKITHTLKAYISMKYSISLERNFILGLEFFNNTGPESESHSALW